MYFRLINIIISHSRGAQVQMQAAQAQVGEVKVM